MVYLDGHGVVEPEVFAAMCRSLAHRGPDDEGIHTFPGGALGMRRLSIIDLEGGHQPMSSPDGECWIVFNGEIYNYRELRRGLERDGCAFRTHSDTEVVLRLYERNGERCLEQLRGMFAFAVWDQRRRSLFLARDRLGIKPLYVYRDPSRLIFASEIKAILADPTVERDLDPIALDHYLSLLYVPAPRTMLRNIEKLPPASYAILKDGAYDCREYWDVVPESRGARMPGSAAEEVAGVLEEAVRLHLVSDVPVGSFLSGGIDSSAVTCVAAQLSERRLETYSVGFQDTRFDESGWARATARHCGAEHREFQVMNAGFDVEFVERVLAGLDEPFADSSALPTYHLAALASQHTKVALSGDGGDELFGGYPHHRNFVRLTRLRGLLRLTTVQRLAGAARAIKLIGATDLGRRLGKAIALGALPDDRLLIALKIYFDEREKRSLVDGAVREAVAAVPFETAFEPYLSRSARFAPLQRLLYLDLKTSLPDDMLFKVDRMSMMNSLEVRVPFLDHRLVELAFRLPAEAKLRGRLGKYVLRRAMAGTVPPPVLRRPKRGFEIPLHSWSNPRFQEFARDVLTERAVREAGCFRWREVERLVEGFEGRVPSASLGVSRYQLNLRFWALLVFQHWTASWLKARSAPRAVPA